MFHEDLVKILPKLINQKGIINVGGKAKVFIPLQNFIIKILKK